jgi:histidine ammonia-lyase
VGASGDLAPLAHLSAVLLGVGEVRVAASVLPAAEGCAAPGSRRSSCAPRKAWR